MEIDGKWSLILGEIISELDPRLLENKEFWDFSAYLPNMKIESSTKKDNAPHVCSEVYLGKDQDPNYQQTAFISEKCSNVPKFDRVLTIILPVTKLSINGITSILNEILEIYSVRIIIITKDYPVKDISYLKLSLFHNIKYYIIKNETIGSAINYVIQNIIQTPFIAVLNNISHFNNQSSLQRLVSVIDNLKFVGVAAGSARDDRGRWMHGCLQIKESNYKIGYEYGYYFSKYECMYCDDVLTPFVARTSLLQKIPFDEYMNKNEVFRDWFIKLRKAGVLVVACPDVMFYNNFHTEITKNESLHIAKKWKYLQLKTHNNVLYNFTCKDIQISCKNIRLYVKSYLLPECCINKIMDVLKILINWGKNNNLEYALNTGNSLGAVKLGGYLPWDFDLDIMILCKDHKKWKKIEKHAKKFNCSFQRHDLRYFTFSCPVTFVDIICRKTLGKEFLPPAVMNISTSILYNGNWVKTFPNPGLYNRGYIGLENLKHAPHWRFLNKTIKGNAMGGYEKAGTWNLCFEPNKHFCLDRYPADGSLPFLKPPW